MAAHRYWGLLVTARPGSGNGVSIAEVEMRATSGGADQCSGGTASGLSSAGQVPANAFDNNDATVWYYGSVPAGGLLLSYDFGSAVTVAEVILRNAAVGSTYPGVTYGPAACWVQWSDDGTAWQYGTPASDLSGLGNAAAATIESVTDTPPVARYVGTPLRVSPGVASGPSGARVFGQVMRNDLADGGAYRVAGTVAIDGTPATPVRRRVRLFHRLTGRLIRETWSALDGTFAFEKIALAEYVVLSDDYNRVYNAVVADAVVSVP